MEKDRIQNKIGKKADSFDEVIPAFLSPNHILDQKKASTAGRRNVISSDQNRPISRGTNAISDFIIRESLHKALTYRHVDLFMQPVVSLPQRHVKFYEFFGRLRIQPGLYLPARDYMVMASEEHIISRLDTIFLTHCLKVMQRQKVRTETPLSYFINIKPFDLRHPDFMTMLLQLLSDHADVADSLIFEMHYNEFLLLSPAETKVLRRLSQIGCRFSVDHVSTLPIDPVHLYDRHIKFVKIKVETLLRESQTDRGFSSALAKKQALDDHGIDLIVEQTESEDDLREVLDFDVKYGQGFLFGRPDFQGVYTAYRS